MGRCPIRRPVILKPIEHNNEYGINLSGPLVPLPGWKDKLFFFGNYNGFRYASETPTQMSVPDGAAGRQLSGRPGDTFRESD